MTSSQITADVDTGLSIVAQIDRLKEQLKLIVERLEIAALEGEQIPLEDDTREGMQYIAQGSQADVPIVITADSITQTFADGSPAHGRIEAAANGRLKDFFKRSVTWKLIARDGKAFRSDASALLGADAPAFISTCLSRDKNGLPKSAVKIEWARADLRSPNS